MPPKAMKKKSKSAMKVLTKGSRAPSRGRDSKGSKNASPRRSVPNSPRRSGSKPAAMKKSAMKTAGKLAKARKLVKKVHLKRNSVGSAKSKSPGKSPSKRNGSPSPKKPRHGPSLNNEQCKGMLTGHQVKVSSKAEIPTNKVRSHHEAIFGGEKQSSSVDQFNLQTSDGTSPAFVPLQHPEVTLKPLEAPKKGKNKPKEEAPLVYVLSDNQTDLLIDLPPYDKNPGKLSEERKLFDGWMKRADMPVVQTTRHELIGSILARWWYVFPEWPPRDLDYKAQLHKRGYRLVSCSNWLDAEDEDDDGYKKAYPIGNFPGVFRGCDNVRLDLRPMHSCPCYANLNKKPTMQLFDYLIQAMKNQILALEKYESGSRREAIHHLKEEMAKWGHKKAGLKKYCEDTHNKKALTEAMKRARQIRVDPKVAKRFGKPMKKDKDAEKLASEMRDMLGDHDEDLEGKITTDGQKFADLPAFR